MKDLALIIGAGIGGLTSGALLARRGWRVIILEQSSRIGGCLGTFSRSGFKFDIGATFFPDILRGGIDLVCRDLDLDLEKVFVDPFAQICIPGHRIGLYKDFDSTMEEWAREFPTEKDKINELLRYLNKIENRIRHHMGRNISDHVSGEIAQNTHRYLNWLLYLAMNKYKKDSAEKTLTTNLKESKVLTGFDLQTMFWGQTKYKKSSLAYASLVMGLHLNGGFCLKGGSDSLPNLLSHYIQTKGGEIRLNYPVREILVKQRKVVGIQLNTGEILEGRCYISNATPWTLYKRLLPQGFKQTCMKRRLSKLPYPSAIFTLFLGVNENCLPSQIGHKVFFLPRGSEEADQIGPLFIALTPKSDTDRAPKGYRALTVFHYISLDGWNRGNEYIKKKDLMQEKTIRALKKLIPFLDEGLCFCESATPLTYEKFTGRPKGMVNGLPQFREIYGNKALSCSTSYQDLFQISDCTSIGLGVEGLCQTSLNLTDRICKKYE